MMRRDAALRAVDRVAEKHSAAVFIGNGLNPRALRAIADRERNFYMVGSMGLALPLAIGFSRLVHAPVIAVEGDGNALMGLPSMALTRAAHRPFIHLILDNQGYESTGGQRTPAPGFAFVQVANAAHYTMALEVEDEPDLAAGLSRAISGKHTCLIHVHTSSEGGVVPPRIPHHPAEIAHRFIASFEKVANG